jgi:DNA-binding NtrC family response regulator
MENSSQSEQGRRSTVLVVDDEPVVCSLASDLLQDAGFLTVEAHSARQAIDLLEADEQVDVVFSDIPMPGIDGFHLQQWIKLHHPKVKVLLASGVENVKTAGRTYGSAAVAGIQTL